MIPLRSRSRWLLPFGNLFGWALFLIGSIGMLGGCRPGPDATGQKYQCPMHPAYLSDRLGDCPICGMRLVRVRENPAPQGHASGTTTAPSKSAPSGRFRCPMHPKVVDEKSSRCPKCGMFLTEEATSSTPGPAQVPTPQRVPIHLSAEKRQLIGLTLVRVERRRLSNTLHTVALVEHDETRLYRIAPRFGGWIRKLYVNYTGAPVERGAPLFRVYSPELYALQEEYLVAWRANQRLGPTADAERKETAGAMLEAVRRRWQFLEIPEEEVRALEARNQPETDLIWRAPVSGHVVRKHVVEGQAFAAGETLLEIASLDPLWIRAFVSESDLPRIRLGQPARIRFAHLPNREFFSRVSFLSPHVDPQTRRATVRLELENPDHVIRPEMWCDVEVMTEERETLVVPAAAVLDTGLGQWVFVDRQEGRLEPRPIRVGLRTADGWEVLAGLHEGEQVVARALFLVDAESQLRAALEAYSQATSHP